MRAPRSRSRPLTTRARARAAGTVAVRGDGPPSPPTPPTPPAPAPGMPTALLGPTGFNLGYSQNLYYGVGFPFLDRFKTNELRNNTEPLNADQYPTAMPSDGKPLSWLINVEGPLGPAGVPQHYVIETNHPGLTLDLTFADKIEDVAPGLNNGVRRIKLDAAKAALDTGYRIELNCRGMTTPFVAGQHWIRMFRADEEALLKSGKIFTQQFLDRMALVDVLRFMDWTMVNADHVWRWADRVKPSDASWATVRGVPYEVQIALCNKTGKHGHFHIPAQVGVTAITERDQLGRPTAVTHDEAIANEFVDNFANLLKTTMRPDLLKAVEFNNEHWNSSFSQYFFLRSFKPDPLPDGADYSKTWVQQGIRGTRLIGRVVKAFNHDPNVLPIWATQAVSPTVTEHNKIGIDRTLAAWADPASPFYDPEMASRYREAGQFYRGGLAITTYFSGFIAYPEIGANDKATVLGWARDSTDAGIQKAFRQLEVGDLLEAGNGSSFAGFTSVMAGNIALAEKYQMPLVVYEGNIEVPAKNTSNYFGFDGQDRADMTAFCIRLYEHPDMRGLFFRAMRLARQQGVVYNDILADLGQAGDAYGTITSAYGPLSPRGLGLQDFKADRGPGKPLAIRLETVGNFNVGSEPITRIIVSGGTGLITLTINGLAPGRVYDGFRTIKGMLTAQGAVELTIDAFDQVGGTATHKVVQNVKPAVVGHRYVHLVVRRTQDGTDLTNPNANAIAAELELLDREGQLIDRGLWTVTGAGRTDPYGNHYPASNLIDGNAGTTWQTPKGEVGVVRIDCGANSPVDPGGFRITALAPYQSYAPGDFELLVSDTGVLANAVSIYKSVPANVEYDANNRYAALIA